MRSCSGAELLCGEDIAVEDLFDVFGLDLGDTFDGGWDEQQLVSGAGACWNARVQRHTLDSVGAELDGVEAGEGAVDLG